MPQGLYKKEAVDNLQIGDLVGVCLDHQKAKLAVEHNILAVNNQCPDGSQMLIKKIIAVPGDRVELTNKHIKVSHCNYHYTYIAPRLKFSAKTHHPVLTFIDIGQYHSTGYWLYGKYNTRKSWDSRYFGEVSAENIISKIKPISILTDKSCEL
ncbi:S26 family signal peptidase [Francisella sp. TX07-6608]|uniref:S26 family signal peptidase n=1 Tax=Francisella sp. TX07-6608 TaxID=573568 RepID=UPI0008F98F05|nr:S26 family signal peptidase [Francisella sp. TX07-6608]OIN85122.1 signal peptidase, peptidase S26 family protein [Francisella sp. TX07-6608]